MDEKKKKAKKLKKQEHEVEEVDEEENDNGKDRKENKVTKGSKKDKNSKGESNLTSKSKSKTSLDESESEASESSESEEESISKKDVTAKKIKKGKCDKKSKDEGVTSMNESGVKVSLTASIPTTSKNVMQAQKSDDTKDGEGNDKSQLKGDVSMTEDERKAKAALTNDRSVEDAAKVMVKQTQSTFSNTIKNSQPSKRYIADLATIDLESSGTVPYILQTTPFMLIKAIPRLIRVKTTRADNSEKDLYIHLDSGNKQVQESYQMFSPGLLAARWELVDSVNGMSITDYHNPVEGTVKVQRIYDTKVDLQPITNAVEARFNAILDVFYGVYRKVYSIPAKITGNVMSMSTSIGTDYVRSAHWEGDYPHPMLAVLGGTIPWLRQYFDQLNNMHPLVIKEDVINNYHGIKSASKVAAVTDQYATALANLAYLDLMAHQMDRNSFIQQIRANAPPNTIIIPKQRFGANSLLYNPDRNGWAVTFYYIMTNPTIKQAMVSKLISAVSDTKMFNMLEVVDVLNPRDTSTDTVANDLRDSLIARTSVGDAGSPATLMVMETFSSYFDIRPTMVAPLSASAAIVDILAILVHFILFPKISNKISHHLQYMLITAMNRYLDTHMGGFIDAYGWQRLRGQRLPGTNVMMGDDDARAGAVYSIFDPELPANPRVNRQLLNLVTDIRVLCTPQDINIVLDRKRDAGYPYWHENYIGKRSWEYSHDYYNHDVNQETATVRRLRRAVDLCLQMERLRVGADAQTRATKSYTNFFQILFQNIKTNFESAGGTFNYTCAVLQEQLMQSFPYVYEEFHPVNKPVGYHGGPFSPPPQLILIPSARDYVGNGLPINLINVYDYNVYGALRMALTLEGLFSRRIKVMDIGNSTSSVNKEQTAREIQHINPLMLSEIALSIQMQAELVGVTHAMVAYLTDADNENNPIREISRILNDVLRMGNWVPLIKSLYSRVGFNFEDSFLGNYKKSGIMDGRRISLAVGYLNPDTGRPINEYERGSRFGQIPPYMTEYIRQCFRIITKLIMDPDNAINFIHDGIYVGRFFTDEMKPTLDGVENGWTVIEWDQVEIDAERCKNGTGVQMIITEDDGITSVWLPYGLEELDKKYMIHIQHLGKIEPWQEMIGKAILAGSLALKIDEFVTIASIVDQPLRTVDCSQRMDEHTLINLLCAMRGAFLQIPFQNTVYAQNFTSTAKVVSKYIQYLSLRGDNSERNVLMAGVENTEAPTPQTKLPDADMISFGGDGNEISRTCPLDPTKLKIDLGVPNLNNDYYACGNQMEEETKNMMEQSNWSITFPTPARFNAILNTR